jgi:hypothetical protein
MGNDGDTSYILTPVYVTAVALVHVTALGLVVEVLDLLSFFCGSFLFSLIK